MDKSKTILLVEDDVNLRNLFRECLEDLSFSVIEAGNGLEAKVMFDTQNVDAVVTDINMPEMNGVELVEYVRSKSELPVFFITGYSDHSREVLNSFKPKAVIFKPFDIEEAALLIKNHFLRAR